MGNKYAFTDETIEFEGHTLHRIKALKTFSNYSHRVEKGVHGGFIEKEENLSQDGDCWVYGDAMVINDAKVYSSAKVFDNAKVYGNVKVFGHAIISDNAKVYDHARISGKSNIGGNAYIGGNANVFGYAVIKDNASVINMAVIYGTAQISGNTKIGGLAQICDDAVIQEIGDYMVFKNSWSSGRYFTWTRSNDMWKVGCFYGTGEELIKKAYKDSEIKGKNYEAIVEYVNKFVSINK